MNDPITAIERLFTRWGTNTYDERISQLEHAVQCAQLAHDAGADDGLVVAALLHDVGHLLALERGNGTVDVTANDSHESTGAAYLARHFPTSVTAPIAMGISDSMGISPTLTAVYAVLTGVIGAILATHLLNALGMKDWTARGFAVGVAAHGIGTSRAFAVHPDAGAFSSVGMGLHGVAGALFLPLIGPWLLGWLA